MSALRIKRFNPALSLVFGNYRPFPIRATGSNFIILPAYVGRRLLSNDSSKIPVKDGPPNKDPIEPRIVKNIPSEVNDKPEEGKKLNIMNKIKQELNHFWVGFKLLGTEIKISARLLGKVMGGESLLRRERRQLKRTLTDLTRLVPFVVIVIIPFMEFALPLIVKLFPRFLPSTFQTEDSLKLKKLNLQKTRIEAAHALKDSALELKDLSKGSDISKAQYKYFSYLKSRCQGLSTDEMIEASRLFTNNITIFGFNRNQLVSLCKYLDIMSVGPNALLRAFIQRRLSYLTADDHTIASEGLESYNYLELKQMCSSRGIRTSGKTIEDLRKQMEIMLDLSVKYKIPNALLILSNAQEFIESPSDKDKAIDHKLRLVIQTITQLPEKILREVEISIKERDGTVTFKEKLEFIEEQERAIQAELTEEYASHDIEHDKDDHDEDSNSQGKKSEAKPQDGA